MIEVEPEFHFIFWFFKERYTLLWCDASSKTDFYPPHALLGGLVRCVRVVVVVVDDDEGLFSQPGYYYHSHQKRKNRMLLAL